MFSNVTWNGSSPQEDIFYTSKLKILHSRVKSFHNDYVKDFVPSESEIDFKNFRLFHINRVEGVLLFFNFYRNLEKFSQMTNQYRCLSTFFKFVL